MAEWKARLEKVLSDQRLGPQSLIEANALTRNNLPSSLYKYRCATALSFDILKSRAVWLASPESFNDPFDSAVTFDVNRIVESIRADRGTPSPKGKSILLKLIQGEYPGLPAVARDALVKSSTEWYARPARWLMSRATRRLRSELKVCCFSETVTSLPMWAHYTGCHTGFCIRWDLSTWSAQPEVLRKLFPVLYDEHPFQMPSLAINPAYHGAELLLALRKAIDWSYEREWRLIDWSGAGQAGLSQELSAPTAVYIGALASKGTKEKLSELGAQLGIDVFQMQCDLERGCLVPCRAR